EPIRVLSCLVRLSRDRGPGAVKLLGTALHGECLQRVDAETSGMRIERRQGRGAGDVRDPRPLRNGTCDLGDRRVGDAQQHQVSRSAGRFAPGAHRQAAFLEPRGDRATGLLQSALGNLPELLISLFALQAGLVTVVQTALIGSILANTLLVLGLAFLFGGLRNGPQQFASDRPRMIAVLLLLATAALAIPALATAPGAPDVGHDRELSVIAAVVLLVVFAASIPFSIGGGQGASVEGLSDEPRWP